LTLVSTRTAEHYNWGRGCDGWHLVKQERLSVLLERMPPGTAEVRHFHSSAWQFFYVLKGMLHFEVAGAEYDVAPREGLEVAPGSPHEVSNRMEFPVEFLVVSQPSSHGDRELAERSYGLPDAGGP
jgi:mannose-6-phosphate isomerase-like protein (cupin superfamily)